ncbi:MAG: restriction endonuclease subunit S [Nocardioides sp.]|nr:restriction endonuclease subunit S [Nocardioides sp.]
MKKLAEVFPTRLGGYWGKEAGTSEVDARAIRNGDVGSSGELRWGALPRRAYTTKEFAKARVHAGDIVLTTSGNCGNVAYVDGEPETPTVATNFVRILRVNPEATEPRYAFHFLRSEAFSSGIAPFVRGATIKNLSVETAFAAVHMPLPPLSEQRRIAAILDHADALRAKRREALALLDGLGSAIFRDMFGNPVNNERGWPVKRLAELGTLDRGVSKHRPRNDPALLGGAYPLIQTGDVANSRGYITRFRSTYSDLGLAQSRLWPAGTLCITIAANIAKTGILTFDACFPDSVVGFTSDPETITFVQAWLGFLQATLEASAPQSAQKNINLAILRELEVPIPGGDLLREFDKRISALKEHRARTCRHQGELDATFDSLQSRAFRGEL